MPQRELPGRGMFRGADADQVVTRYHSLVVEDTGLPAELEVSARSRDDGYIMAMRHRELPVESVQFHPESITTQAGIGLFRSYLETYVAERTGEEPLAPRDPSRAP